MIVRKRIFGLVITWCLLIHGLGISQSIQADIRQSDFLKRTGQRAESLKLLEKVKQQAERSKDKALIADAYKAEVDFYNNIAQEYATSYGRKDIEAAAEAYLKDVTAVYNYGHGISVVEEEAKEAYYKTLSVEEIRQDTTWYLYFLFRYNDMY